MMRKRTTTARWLYFWRRPSGIRLGLHFCNAPPHRGLPIVLAAHAPEDSGVDFTNGVDFAQFSDDMSCRVMP